MTPASNRRAVPPSGDNLDTEQDRAHCRADLDAVHDAPSAARFVQRWRRNLEGYLIDPPEPPEYEDERDSWGERERELEATLNDAESALTHVQRELGTIAEQVLEMDNDDPEDGRAGALVSRLTALSMQIDAVTTELAKV